MGRQSKINSSIVRASKVIAAVLSLAMGFGSCRNKTETLPFYHTADFSPIWADEEKINTDTLHTIAPFSFTDQNNQTITNKTLQGKIYAANFFFTSCPSICPKMTNNMHLVADSFANNPNVALLSYSVTPDIDNVEKLHQYAQNKNINGNQWHLLTGNRSAIYQLARQSYFAEEEPGFTKDSTEFLHTEHCVLVDKKGHIRGIYNATLKLEMTRLIADIAILLKEN
jgi:protein SCO1